MDYKSYYAKDMLKKRGIYFIVNTVNDHVYVGSTTESFAKRWSKHTRDFKMNKNSRHLQSAYNLYGAGVFRFVIIEVIDTDNDGYILEREQYWLDVRRTQYPMETNYNISWTAGNTAGVEYTEERLAKMSSAAKAYWSNPENRKAKSEAMKGVDTSKAVSASIAARKGKPRSEETKQRISAANKQVSDELRRKRSEAAKVRWNNPEVRDKLCTSMKGKKKTMKS